MALSIKEQLDAINGLIIPNDSSYTLGQLTNQVAINEAQDFITNAPTISGGTNHNAYSYLTKYLKVCGLVMDGRVNSELLEKVIIAIYADTGTYGVISDATTSQWTNFIESSITNAFEIIGKILPYEKTDYDSL